MKFRIRVPTWPIFLAIAVLTVTGISLAYAWLPPIVQIDLAVYWFDLWYPDMRKWLAFVCIPLLFSLWLIRMFWVLFKNRDELVRLWIFPILIIANIAACVSCLPGAVYVNEHQDSVYFDDKVFNVMWSYGLIGIGGVTRPYMTMYECDRFGIFCQIVHTYGGWREGTYDLDATPWKARLLVDTVKHSVSLEVNGEVVYVHHPG